VDGTSVARSLKRYWYLPVLGALAAISAAVVLSASEVPIYESKATYIVSPGSSVTVDAAESIRTLDDPKSRAVVSTYIEVLASQAVEREAAISLGLDPSIADDYDVSALLMPEANVVELTVAGPVPEIAVALSETIGARGSETFETLYQIYDVGLLDPADFPTEPSGRALEETALLAAALGFLLGAGVAVLAGMPVEGRRRKMQSRIEHYGGPGAATITALPTDRDARYSRTG